MCLPYIRKTRKHERPQNHATWCKKSDMRRRLWTDLPITANQDSFLTRLKMTRTFNWLLQPKSEILMHFLIICHLIFSKRKHYTQKKRDKNQAVLTVQCSLNRMPTLFFRPAFHMLQINRWLTFNYLFQSYKYSRHWDVVCPRDKQSQCFFFFSPLCAFHLSSRNEMH